MKNYRKLNIKLSAKASISASKGFTLVELMISLTLGLVLFAGVISIFAGIRTTTSHTTSFGELQENGRFAVSVLTDDLMRQNFWGDYSGDLSLSQLGNVPNPPLNDCVGAGLNNATFPQAIGQFRTIWAETITAGSLDPLGCFTTPANTSTRVGSDVIQLKRAVANPVTAVADGNYYIIINSSLGGIYDSATAANVFAAAEASDDAADVAEILAVEAAAEAAGTDIIGSARMWMYQHHVYYVRDTTVAGETVPVLMQGRLTNGAMTFSPVIDGIEMIRFMYSVDTNGDSVADATLSADNVDIAGIWNNPVGSRIMAVKVYVLARGINPDRQYTNTDTYQLGDITFTANDNYRRLLFSSTISLHNNTELAF